ncbi:hypothetical protein [Dyadobacter tibetensis]|uniref:hypothetical protein n=1 Tax=Dyadobacter tibetensis TaxID=1211851 RepID=UPI0004710774|nr:hypothetical protein [Dyadobacter tibetensis]
MDMIILLKALGNLFFAGILLFAICFWGVFCGVIYTLGMFVKEQLSSNISKSRGLKHKATPSSWKAPWKAAWKAESAGRSL